MTQDGSAEIDGFRPPPALGPSVLAAVLAVTGLLLWPVALRGEYDPQEYVALFLADGVMVVLAVVLLLARRARVLSTAMLAGGLPVAAAQVWWLLGDSWAQDWPVPVASGLLVAGSLVAAWARRDPFLVSRYRRWSVGLALAALLTYVAALAVEPGAFAAVVALVTMVVPLVVVMGCLVGRRLGTALATATVLLAFGVLQDVSADSFLSAPVLLRAAAVLVIAAAAVVATLNPVVSYRQSTPAVPALVAVAATVVTLVGGVAAASAAAAEPVDDTAAGASASASPSPSRSATAKPGSASPSASPTPAATAPAVPAVAPYPGQRPKPVAGFGLDPRCDLSTGRTICVDKTARKLYFVVGDQVLLRLDARFGGDANPTREGDWTIYRKDADHTSTVFGSKMPYAMFFSGGEAIHYSIDFATRGYAGHSHGCVNIRDLDALAWLFPRAPIGTPVHIYS